MMVDKCTKNKLSFQGGITIFKLAGIQKFPKGHMVVFFIKKNV
jgi:hypothetical protein